MTSIQSIDWSASHIQPTDATKDTTKANRRAVSIITKEAWSPNRTGNSDEDNTNSGRQKEDNEQIVWITSVMALYTPSTGIPTAQGQPGWQYLHVRAIRITDIVYQSRVYMQ